MAGAISISMATTTSTSIHRLSNKPTHYLSFDYSPITLIIQQPTQTKPNFLKIKTPSKTHLNLLFHSNSSAFNSYETKLEEKQNDDYDDYDDYDEDEEDYDEEEDDDDYDYEDEEEEEEEDKESIKSPARNSKDNRLYVGNLPYSMTSSQLRELFGEAGRVISAEIVYDRVTDRSRGFAFVKMASLDEAQVAIRMFEGSQVGGRTVKVNFPEVPRGGERVVMGPKIHGSYRNFVDSPHKIYAGNLSWRITSENLRDVFANQPGLLGVKVIYERDTGKARGFGFITFDSAAAAQSALDAMNGMEVDRRPLRLNMAADRANPVTPQVEGTESERETDITADAMESTVSSVY